MKALIFDMDGVLVDVSESYRIAAQKAAEYILNKKVDISIIDRLKKRTGFNDDYDLTRKLVSLGGKVVSHEEVARHFDHFYWGKKNDGLVKNERWLFDYALLRKIYGRYKLGIVTGRPRRDAEYALKQFTAANFFDAVICAEDVRDNKKPNPLGLRLALKHFSTKDAIFIGDSVDDMEMAKAIGIQGIGINHGDDELKSLLLEHGASVVIDNVNEIQSVLERK